MANRKKKQCLLNEQLRVRVSKKDQKYLLKKSNAEEVTVSELIRSYIKEDHYGRKAQDNVKMMIACENLLNHILLKGYTKIDDKMEGLVNELWKKL